MSYVDDNLAPDETVLYRAHIHWVIYIGGLVFIIGALFFYKFPWLALAIFACGVIQIIRSLIFATTTEFAVTNQRIIAKTGWVARAAVEVRHEKVETLTLVQGAWGRMFNYGTLVLSGTGTGRTILPNIDDPLTFRKYAIEAQEADERDNGLR